VEQTRDELTQNLAERLCWQVARRDDSRVARLDDFFAFLPQLGVVALLGDVQGTAVQRKMVPFVQDYPALQSEDLGGDRGHACAARFALE
jgi:hypothetical protein